MTIRFLLIWTAAALAAEETPLLSLAERLPPEIAAAALLRAAPAAGEQRGQWLERAFQLGGKARHRLPVAAVPGLPGDSRALVISAARMDYDALSLQSRAVTQMIAVDPGRARRMFEEMQRATPEPATCEDSLLADLGPYYDALGELIRSGFTAEERKEGAQFGFALAALNRIGSVPELRPAARMTASLDWPGPQLALAMGSLEAAMKAHSTFSEFQQPDNRSYLASFSQIEKAMAGIIRKARKAGLETESFSTTYRFFVVRQMRAARCNDTDPELVKQQPVEPSDVFGPEVAGGLPALGVQEVTPVMLEGEIRVERFWQTGEAKELLEAYLPLTKGADGKPLPAAAYQTEEWQKRAAVFAGRLEKWQPGAETGETDGYHQKAMLYESMLGVVADGALHERLARGFLGLLKQKISLRESDAVEWSWHARAALGLPGGRGLAALYRQSGDPILEAEAAGR